MKSNKSRKFYKVNRLWLIVFILIAISLYTMYKYISVALINGEAWTQEAMMQWTKSYPGNDNRGEILADDATTRLAVNIPAYTIWANPKEYESNEKKDMLMATLPDIIGRDANELLEIFSGKGRKKLVQWANEDMLQKISLIEDTRGLEIENRKRRFYPEGKLYNHIIGFTDIDLNGLSGVELTYNEKLMGKPERIVRQTDNNNHELPFKNTVSYGGSKHGDIVLTINDKIQRIAQEEVKRAKEDNKAKNVSIIIMDPSTGDIYAMADSNSFDINDPRAPIDDAQAADWADNTEEEMVDAWQNNWNNLNVNVLYEPGSTFKSITLAAAIEEGVVDDSTELYCNGAITDIPGVTLKCVKYPKPHGTLNITTAYAESCNVAFVQIGRKLGRDKFYKYIKAFGFGDKTGIELNGEQYGIIPKSVEQMTPVTLATATFGQGIASTNLQICMATSAIVNGGDLLVPRIVKEIREGDKVIYRNPVNIKRKVLSKFTSEKMKEIMEYSVLNANKRAQVKGYRVGGKSGTAQKAENGKYLKNTYMASFVGVAPIDDPKLLVLVNVDEPGNGITFGGAVAGPVSARIMEKVLPLLGITPSDDEAEGKTGETVEVPNVIGKTLIDATSLLRESGLKYYIEEDDIKENSIIKEMSIVPGTVVVKDTIVDLKLEVIDEKEFVPDFRGLTITEAVKLSEERNIVVVIEGTGICTGQSVDAGKKIEGGMKLTLRFE